MMNADSRSTVFVYMGPADKVDKEIPPNYTLAQVAAFLGATGKKARCRLIARSDRQG